MNNFTNVRDSRKYAHKQTHRRIYMNTVYANNDNNY